MEQQSLNEFFEEQFKERLKVFILEQAIEFMDNGEFQDFRNYLSKKGEKNNG